MGRQWTPMGASMASMGRQWDANGRQWTPMGRQWTSMHQWGVNGASMGRQWDANGRQWDANGASMDAKGGKKMTRKVSIRRHLSNVGEELLGPAERGDRTRREECNRFGIRALEEGGHGESMRRCRRGGAATT